MPNPILVAELEWTENADAKIVISKSSQSVLNAQAVKLHGKPVKVVVSSLTKKKLRSVEQNNYYWGVVLKILAEDLGYIGPGEKEDLHNELRSIFLVRTGKLGQPTVESTTRLSTELFEKYLEAIRNFAKERFGIIIPMPNEAETSSETDTYRKL